MSYEVVFSAADREYAMKLAHARNDPKMGTVPNYRYTQKRSDLEVHYLGILAEMAVSRTLNLPLDTTIDLGGDRGYDFEYRGQKIQVKYNSYSWGDLYINKDDSLIADVYILVTGNDQKMLVVGWAKRMDFHTIAKVKDFGHGPRLAIEQTDLRRFPLETS